MIRTGATPSPLEATIFVEGLRARPALFLASTLVVYAVLWTLTAWLADPTPDPKLAVGLALGREWQLGYVDSSPLAPWILELGFRIGGLAAAYALGPLTVAFTGWLVFLFARRIVGDRHAAIAVFLMVGVHPVAFPAGAFDADILQMPLVALTVLSWWLAVVERRRLAWIALGVTLAALAYAGVTGIFVVATLALLTAAAPAGRSVFRSHDMLVAAVAGLFVFTLLITPRLIWLQHHEFAGALPASYGDAWATIRSDAFGIAAVILLGHAGLLLLVFLASPLRSPDRETAPIFMRPPLDRFARTVVVALALLPPLLAFVAVAWTGGRLPSAAAAPLVLYSGLLVVVLADEALRIHRQRAVAVGALTLLVLPPVLEVASSFAAPWVGEAGRPTNWPAAAASRYVTDVYRTRTGQPLDVVVGDLQTASVIALASPDRPRVFDGTEPLRTPWLDLQQVTATGAVVIWPVEGADTAPPAAFAWYLPALVPEAPLTYEWVRPGRLDRVRLGWAIIPPANATAARSR